MKPDSKPKAILVDIDGVLACNWHRIKHIHDNRENPDWDGFYKDMHLDPLLEGWLPILRAMHCQSYSIILVTNRPGWLQARTLEWLAEHNVPWDTLLMRPEGHEYSSAKQHHVDQLKHTYSIELALDDDPHHVDMYRRNNISCIYVHSGYYDEGRVPDDRIIR